ncbi:MAG: hypothetical protein KDD55_00205 [Bdellovibrionales bacterium]|nr:hypothetical protein [Bdellovibrionales bacterium]
MTVDRELLDAVLGGEDRKDIALVAETPFTCFSLDRRAESEGGGYALKVQRILKRPDSVRGYVPVEGMWDQHLALTLFTRAILGQIKASKPKSGNFAELCEVATTELFFNRKGELATMAFEQRGLVVFYLEHTVYFPEGARKSYKLKKLPSCFPIQWVLEILQGARA